MRRAVVMLGIPASGKGTQAEILAKRIAASIIGIGELVRAEIKNGDQNSAQVKKIKENYDKGIPQNDEIIRDLLEKEVAKTTGDLIFDNYPFSADQITNFEQLLRKYNFSRPLVLLIKVDPESSIKRIATRRICDKCKKVYLSGNVGDDCPTDCGGKLTQRPDDTEEVMRERVDHAKPRIDLVINHYRQENIVHEIDGEKSIVEVSEEIKKVI